jgi:hypothetical protein
MRKDYSVEAFSVIMLRPGSWNPVTWFMNSKGETQTEIA